ncbi:nuclear transcription factor Y subunit B-3 [Geranomyces variabilis]|nr:nuclear transcription factor Y subunit B-3 [Geranomyces variabilis]
MADSSDQPPQGADYDDFREQDRFLPTANVARLMKKALPDNSKIAKEAKDCIMECVSEFISFVTSEGRSTPRDNEGIKNDQGRPPADGPDLSGPRYALQPRIDACLRSARLSTAKTFSGRCSRWALIHIARS